MKKVKFLLLAVFAVLSFSLVGMLTACGSKDPKVYLITMDTIDAHWSNVHKGAGTVVADYEGDVKFSYVWDGPYTKDANAQLDVINNAVTNNAKVILLAASSGSGSKATVEAAMKKGVEFIYVDSPSDAPGALATYNTDNTAAGKDAGEKLLAALTEDGIDKGVIGILFPDGSPTVNARADGFKAAFEGKTGEGKFTFDEKTSGATAVQADAQTNANGMISAGHVAIYATNETTLKGLAGATGVANIIACGFDIEGSVIEPAIRDGRILFAVGQYPSEMGRLGMEAAILVLEGKKASIKQVPTTGHKIYFEEDVK